MQALHAPSTHLMRHQRQHRRRRGRGRRVPLRAGVRAARPLLLQEAAAFGRLGANVARLDRRVRYVLVLGIINNRFLDDW